MAANFGIITPSEWVGLTLEESKKKAEREGFSVRLVEIDGRSLMLTEDLKNNRVNLRISNDKVIGAFPG